MRLLVNVIVLGLLGIFVSSAIDLDEETAIAQNLAELNGRVSQNPQLVNNEDSRRQWIAQNRFPPIPMDLRVESYNLQTHQVVLRGPNNLYINVNLRDFTEITPTRLVSSRGTVFVPGARDARIFLHEGLYEVHYTRVGYAPDADDNSPLGTPVRLGPGSTAAITSDTFNAQSELTTVRLTASGQLVLVRPLGNNQFEIYGDAVITRVLTEMRDVGAPDRTLIIAFNRGHAIVDSSRIRLQNSEVFVRQFDGPDLDFSPVRFRFTVGEPIDLITNYIPTDEQPACEFRCMASIGNQIVFFDAWDVDVSRASGFEGDVLTAFLERNPNLDEEMPHPGMSPEQISALGAALAQAYANSEVRASEERLRALGAALAQAYGNSEVDERIRALGQAWAQAYADGQARLAEERLRELGAALAQAYGNSELQALGDRLAQAYANSRILLGLSISLDSEMELWRNEPDHEIPDLNNDQYVTPGSPIAVPTISDEELRGLGDAYAAADRYALPEPPYVIVMQPEGQGPSAAADLIAVQINRRVNWRDLEVKIDLTQAGVLGRTPGEWVNVGQLYREYQSQRRIPIFDVQEFRYPITSSSTIIRALGGRRAR